MKPLHELTIAEIQLLLQQKQFSSREITGHFLDRIAQQHANQVVVAVVHGGIIGHILAHASGAEPFAFNGCDNGSISHVVLTEGKIVVRGFNDRSHLVSLGDVGVAVPT